MTRVERYARYRAPEGNGQRLVVPPWSEMGDVLAESAAWRARADVGVLDEPLAEFSAAARRELIAESAKYVASFGAPLPLAADVHERPLILTGHQPELVHPGVWLKNIAAAALAEQHGGAAVQLVIDADACRSTAIRVPTGSVHVPRLDLVEFDRPAAAMPWEERRILDNDCWRSFPDRVAKATSSLLADRMINQWWPMVVERSAATGLIGASLAQARYLSERAWGCRNLELPQSQMCQTVAFRRFALHILRELPRFVDAYNSALADYRRLHHLRNHAQPVPDLDADGVWLEAPFWLWTAADPQRRAVFIRSMAGSIIVSDRAGFERTLPTGAGETEQTLAEMREWETAGVKLRSRALITTMFARLALADLFIHGIGGARYDEATDAICERFFSTAPPAYATLSGTLRLPIAHPPGGAGDASKLRRQLRELEFHPERHLPFDRMATSERSSVEELVKIKERAVQSPSTPAGAAARHQAIVSANQGLHALLNGRRATVEQELAASIDRARHNRILDSREYAFCLYPSSLLEEFLLDFST